VPEHKIYSKKVYKQAVYEFQHSEASRDWLQNLLTAAATFRAITSELRLTGYIQYIECDNALEITLFSYKQLECLAKTPYEVTNMHYDATGTKVSVDDGSELQKFASYKRILNHTVLIRNRAMIGMEISVFQLGKFYFMNLIL
jgi:hypothetical protein